MANLADKLRQLLRQTVGAGEFDMDQIDNASFSSSPDSLDPNEPVTANTIQLLMRMLEMTQQEAYSCEETFALLDEYVEAVIRNEANGDVVMPLVKYHLDACPDCYQKFEILLRILETESAS